MTGETQPELQIIETEFPPFIMGPQHQLLSAAVHSGLAPIEDLSCGVVRMPGGHHAEAHIHATSAITVCVSRGMIASLIGEEMTPRVHAPGSILYIGPGIPHLGVNLNPPTTAPAQLGWRGRIGAATGGLIELRPSRREARGRRADAFEIRTDPTFNTDVVRRPDLDGLVAERVAQLRHDFARGLFAAKLAEPSVHVATWQTEPTAQPVAAPA